MAMKLEYPPTPHLDCVEEIHGVAVADPYRWLEDVESQQTQNWIDQQNRLTFAYLEKIPGRDAIRRRMTRLWDFEKYGVPSSRGGRYFFTRNDGLQNQSALYWMSALDEPPKLLLDPNLLSEDGTIALTAHAVSQNGRFLAYGLSASGSDWQEWHVREVATGHDREDHLRWVKFSGAAWTHDHRGFFYSRYDEPKHGLAYKGANYYHKLYYHQVGDPQSKDRLVYERSDKKEWGFHAVVSDDGRYLIIIVTQGTRRENAVFYQDLLDESSEVLELLPDFDATYTFVGNDGPVFYVSTDLDAPMGRLVAIDTSRSQRRHWRLVIAESADSLQRVSYVGNRFFATYLHDAHSRVQLFDKGGRNLGEFLLPGMGTVEGFDGHPDDVETFFKFTGFATPGTVYRYDIQEEESAVFREPELALDTDNIVTKQVFYASKDGTQIPMFISYRGDIVLDGNNPTYLYGYGGFDISLTPAFSVSNLVWIEMGGIFAQANLRGGGEYGKAWHEAGMKLNKQNVFDDFIAAAEWLIEQGYTRPARLAIGGRSNGGLLIGACMTQRPDLFGACLPVVGVLDMLRFHKFTIGWAWTSDYGSREEPQEFRALLRYSPYHSVRPGIEYPPTLITTGDHDDRVYPAHSYKFAAALQAAQSGSGPALIRIDRQAGHGLRKPTAKLIDEATDLWAFVLQALDMELQGIGDV
jgi:prolyl oligopeptidase